jgi:hypothetical protein
MVKASGTPPRSVGAMSIRPRPVCPRIKALGRCVRGNVSDPDPAF